MSPTATTQANRQRQGEAEEIGKQFGLLFNRYQRPTDSRPLEDHELAKLTNFLLMCEWFFRGINDRVVASWLAQQASTCRRSLELRAGL